MMTGNNPALDCPGLADPGLALPLLPVGPGAAAAIAIIVGLDLTTDLADPPAPVAVPFLRARAHAVNSSQYIRQVPARGGRIIHVPGIDVRSDSRAGLADLGTNARRVRAFLERMAEH